MQKPDDMLFASASAMAAAIRSRKIGCVEILNSCLERIEQVNGSINAVVQTCPERALDEARHYDDLASRSRFAGPLHGVPITLKDSIDTAGIISTGGTRGREFHIPEIDAPVARRLRDAGAVLVGKTNTPELTLSGETNNQIYGRTNNPFDLDRSPGGSSGGSAAIVACGGSFLELGSDTGGSIREPAHLCGIAGIKPTSGRTPRTGHIVPHGGGVLDSLTQIGPMARYVEDLALSLPLICGPDGVDPYVVPVALRDPKHVDVRSLRIAWYSHNGMTAPSDDIVRVVEEVATELGKQKFDISHHPMPGMENLVNLSTALREAGNAGLIKRLLQRYGTSKPGRDLDFYLTEKASRASVAMDPVLLEQIDEARSQALQFMKDYDVILCPPSHTIARAHRSSHKDTFSDWSYITVHNLLGWPGATVRAGTSAQGGMPVGVQVVSAPWSEDLVLAMLQHIEHTFGGFEPPPIAVI